MLLVYKNKDATCVCSWFFEDFFLLHVQTWSHFMSS